MKKLILITIGVIILFLGVTVNPAIATVEPETIESDDCELCPSLSEIIDTPLQGPPICKLLLIMLGINLLGGVILDLIFLPLRLLPFHILFNLLSSIYYYFGDIFGDNVRNIADIAWENDCDWALPSLINRQDMRI